VNQRLPCRCPCCGGIHRVAVELKQTGGIDVDERARLAIICAWCIRHGGGSTRQLLDRERARSINVN
jgi:hypothetical protein